MRHFVLQRLLQMVVTLAIVAILVFAFSELLPGDIGRAMLGRFATPDQVLRLNHELGADRPLVERFVDWATHFAAGDWGTSQLLDTPVQSLVVDRLANSLLLSVVALIVVVPLSILAGLMAGVNENGLVDRFVTVVGLSMTVIPEFVSGVVLLVIFAVALHILPVTAQAPQGSGLGTRIEYLILPSLPLVFELFGYIARMARATTLAVVEAPYYRTAILKGLPRRRILTHHVLRNSLPASVTVVAAQFGYLVGGLVVVERLFNYPGIGKLLLDSAVHHDIRVVEACALTLAVLIMVANLVADVSYGVLNPRVRYAGR